MEDDYQRAGIGEEMLKVAEELHNDFFTVNHFSTEGAAFFNGYCEKGISKFYHQPVKDDRF